MLQKKLWCWLILCFFFEKLPAHAFVFNTPKTDTGKGFTGFIWSNKPKHDTTIGSAIFPFILPDSSFNYKQTGYYYAFDSLHFQTIAIESSEFYHPQKTKTEYAEVKPAMPEKWLFYIILGLAVIVVFVKSVFARFFVELWKSFFNFNNALQMMRQQDISFSVPGLLLSINFYVAMATYLFLNIHQKKLQISFNELLLIPILMAFIIGFVLFRFAIYQFSIVLFNRKNELQAVSFIDLLQLEFTGIIMVPMILLLAFGSPAILQAAWIGSYILLASILIYRTIVAWRIAGSLLFANLFHFILYICTVEIAPVLILLKWVQQWSVLK